MYLNLPECETFCWATIINGRVYTIYYDVERLNNIVMNPFIIRAYIGEIDLSRDPNHADWLSKSLYENIG